MLIRTCRLVIEQDILKELLRYHRLPQRLAKVNQRTVSFRSLRGLDLSRHGVAISPIGRLRHGMIDDQHLISRRRHGYLRRIEGVNAQVVDRAASGQQPYPSD